MKPVAWNWFHTTGLDRLSSHWRFLIFNNVIRWGGHGFALVYEQKEKKRWWVYPYFTKNVQRRSFVAAQEVDVNLVKVHEFYKISKETFNELVRLVGSKIFKKNKLQKNYECWRKAVDNTQQFISPSFVMKIRNWLQYINPLLLING